MRQRKGQILENIFVIDKHKVFVKKNRGYVMLHVVLLILKIIGIILSVVIGLIILLLCIVLFAPIRYKITGNVRENIKKAQVLCKVSWLLHLITAKVSYQENVWDWQVRIGWIKLNGNKKQDNIVLNKTPNEIPLVSKEATTILPQEKQNNKQNNKQNEKQNKKQDEKQNEKQAISQDTNKKSKWKFQEKFKNIFQKIKYTIKNIYDKIKRINDKKKMIMNFLSEDVHQRAWAKLKKEGVCLLKKLIPKKFIAKVVLGFEDPCTTGHFLAGYSIVFPFLPKRVVIRPDFERAILEGEALLKGYIQTIWIVTFIWQMIWDKDVRKTYYDVKEFKEGM